MLYSNIYKASIYFQNLRYEQEIKLLLYAHRCNYMALFAIKQMDYKLGLCVSHRRMQFTIIYNLTGPFCRVLWLHRQIKRSQVIIFNTF